MNIDALKGRTFSKVRKISDDELVFESAGYEVRFFHLQDCCESVRIEDIAGDLEDLEGSEILLAEVVTNSDDIIEGKPQYPDSFTWTFYKFATAKGAVTVRWLGESNGYYSESVDMAVNGQRVWR